MQNIWRIVVLVGAIAGGQDPPATFEVASVRPTVASGGNAPLPLCVGDRLQVSPVRFVATNTTLYSLITWAYNIRYSCFIVSDADLLSGGPGWILSDRFDIQATIPAGSPVYTRQEFLDGAAPRLQAMLRNLLAGRFKVALHRSTKEMRVYTLSPLSGGAKLSASQNEEPAGARLTLELDQNKELVVRIAGNKASMTDLAHLIEPVTHTPVLDRTGFTGDFGFDVRFAGMDPPNQNAAERIALIGALGQFPPALKPSIFTVLQEQLGLKLEMTRDSVETWVIDHAEKPSEN